MQNNFLSIFLLALLFMGSCKKSELEKDNDLAGSKHIRGRLFLYDMETRQANGQPIANRKLLMRYTNSADSNNYLFSTTTDAAGYFIFQNLKENTSYRIFFEDTIGKTLYSVHKDFTAPQDSVQLTATLNESKQNGFILSIKDANGTGTIKDAKVCVFTSESLFNGGTCEGSLFTLTSNEQGKAFAFQLPAGTYYLNATITINGVALTARKSIQVTAGKGISRTDLNLSTPAAANSLQITTVDQNGALIPNAQLCFFTSRVLFNRDTCGGSNFQVYSNPEGKASKTGIFKAYYYVYAEKFIDSTFSYIGKDSFIIGDGSHTRTIKLQ